MTQRVRVPESIFTGMEVICGELFCFHQLSGWSGSEVLKVQSLQAMGKQEPS